eukprot:354819-Chlamydomonas_euryale.AAC.2
MIRSRAAATCRVPANPAHTPKLSCTALRRTFRTGRTLRLCGAVQAHTYADCVNPPFALHLDRWSSNSTAGVRRRRWWVAQHKRGSCADGEGCQSGKCAGCRHGGGDGDEVEVTKVVGTAEVKGRGAGDESCRNGKGESDKAEVTMVRRRWRKAESVLRLQHVPLPPIHQHSVHCRCVYAPCLPFFYAPCLPFFHAPCLPCVHAPCLPCVHAPCMPCSMRHACRVPCAMFAVCSCASLSVCPCAMHAVCPRVCTHALGRPIPFALGRQAAQATTDTPPWQAGGTCYNRYTTLRAGGTIHNSHTTLHCTASTARRHAIYQVDYMRMMSGGGGGAAGSERPQGRGISRDELRAHRSPGDAWIALKGKVYDVTSYLSYHPGGARVLLGAAGTDATRLFQKHHAWVDADYLLSASTVGWLEE